MANRKTQAGIKDDFKAQIAAVIKANIQAFAAQWLRSISLLSSVLNKLTNKATGSMRLVVLALGSGIKSKNKIVKTIRLVEALFSLKNPRINPTVIIRGKAGSMRLRFVSESPLKINAWRNDCPPKDTILRSLKGSEPMEPSCSILWGNTK